MARGGSGCQQCKTCCPSRSPGHEARCPGPPTLVGASGACSASDGACPCSGILADSSRRSRGLAGRRGVEFGIAVRVQPAIRIGLMPDLAVVPRVVRELIGHSCQVSHLKSKLLQDTGVRWMIGHRDKPLILSNRNRHRARFGSPDLPSASSVDNRNPAARGTSRHTSQGPPAQGLSGTDRRRIDPSRSGCAMA